MNTAAKKSTLSIRRVICYFFVFITVLLLLVLSFPTISNGSSPHRAATNAMLAHFKIALTAYITEYGTLPVSSKNYRLYSIISGENPRQIVFMEFNSKTISPNQEMLDAWGTPYRFEFTDPLGFEIVSAGKDQLFNTKDDLSSE